MENTALAIRASLRSSTLPPAAIAAPVGNPKSFRDIFCRSLEPKSVAVPSVSIPITAESNITTPVRRTQSVIASATTALTTQHAEKKPARCLRVLEKFDPAHLNVDREEFEQDIAEYGLKTLKHSRWAEDDGTHRTGYRRNSRGYEQKKLKNAHRTEENIDLPRVHFDVEEFKRDVAKYGLKTLKDSRWAE
ncbi:hypothetical protein GQX73_g10881 [Xylaria multiplex]|uniref:Uncharacterized protein n=1 Tax=Xylaria multiplex TaxID=323545 RepID=A0A7C8MPY0_9PEZI|nr:hypothetical protein GQX73_g10881 [Xylaria multiplex]